MTLRRKLVVLQDRWARPTSYRLWPAVLMAIFAGLVFPDCEATCAQPAVSKTAFDFSSDPAEKVLAITYFGGLTGAKTMHAIYGDGKCEVRKLNNRGGQKAPRELSLSYAEAREIINIAVEHGLVGISIDEILQKTGRGGGEAAMYVGAEDLGDMLFELELTSYRKNGQELGPIATRLVLHGPALLWSTYPDVPELQGLAKLAGRMEELAARAVKSSTSGEVAHEENSN